MAYFCSKRSECTFHLLIWVSARKFSSSAPSWQEIVQIRILGYNLVSLMLDPISERQAEVRSDLNRPSSPLTTSPRAHLWRSPDGTWYLFCIRSPLGLMWMTLCLRRWSFQLLPWAHQEVSPSNSLSSSSRISPMGCSESFHVTTILMIGLAGSTPEQSS